MINLDKANSKLIKDIKYGVDKIGFNVNGGIFDMLEILGTDLLQKFMLTIVIEDNKHDDYVDDCTDYLGSKIETFLNSHDMKLPELADLVGITHTKLRGFIYEKDNDPILEYDVLTKLATYFGCTYSELCDVNYILKIPS